MSKDPTIKKRMKSALNFINSTYLSGATGYARVDNDFITPESSYDMFPHPVLNRAMKRFKPFKKKTHINVTKEEVILFLSAIRVITPHQIEEVFNYLDFYLNDNLYPYNAEKEKEVEIVLKTLDEFIASLNTTDRKILDMQKEFFHSSRENSKNMFVFFQDKVTFINSTEKSKARSGYIVREKLRTEKLEEESSTQKFPGIRKNDLSIRSALDFFVSETSEENLNIPESNTIINPKN